MITHALLRAHDQRKTHNHKARAAEVPSGEHSLMSIGGQWWGFNESPHWSAHALDLVLLAAADSGIG
jgi:hypothetical protein